MKYSNSVEYNISTKLDKSGLTQLQTQIKQVELTMQQMANKELISAPKVQAAREQLQGLSTALTKSFNPSLGMLDLSKFRAELTESKVTAEGLQTAFSLTGAQGAQAFGTLARQIGNFNNGIERTSSTLDKMFVTFSNTFRWGLISSFFSQFMNALHSSVQYARDLDDSLTQIMLVTDYSRDSMNEYARAANEAAKAVGQTTVGMTNASLIFAQQGYDLDQSQQLATLSAKLANASQQDTAATSDQITAYMNAYGLQNSMDELVQAMDNWAKIANISAADVEEIALASQRAASMANAVGVSGEALAAQIATIESVTREAPEQIGNGLKTLYARFSDLKLGKDDEDGIGLGKVTSTLQQIGVQVVDAFGNVRDMDDIMEDLMVVWEDLDDTSKTAAAQALAGKHQVNRFMALMENADMYREYKGATGASASGTLEEMNTEYLDSLQGRLTKLQSTFEGLFNDVFTTDMVYPLIDALTKLAEAVDTLFKSVGSGPAIIIGLASAFTQLFSQNIARGINNMMNNQQIANIRKSNLANVQGTLEQTGLNNFNPEVSQYIQAGADRAGAMNAEQYRAYTDQLDKHIIAAQNAAAANEKLEDTYLAVGAAAGVAFKDTDSIFKDEESIINVNNLTEHLKDFANNKDIMKQFAAIDFTSSIEGAEKFSHSLAVLNDALQRLKNEQNKNFDWNLDRAVDSIELSRDALYDLHDAGALTNDEFEEAKEIINTAFDELADTSGIEKNAAALDNLNVKMARFAEALKHIGPEVLAKGPEAIQAAIQEYIAATRNLEDATGKSKGVIQDLDQQLDVQTIVKATSAIGQLAFAIRSIANLPSIWKNEDLTLGEKFLQTVTNLTMVIPSLVSAFDSLNKAFALTKLGKTIIATEALAIAREHLAIVTKKVEKVEEALEKAQNKGQLLATAVLTEYLNKTRKEQAKAAAEAKAAEDGLTAAEGAQSIAAIVAAKATELLNKALGTLKAMNPEIIAFMIGFIALAAAVGAVVHAIQEDAKRAEEAKQQAIDALHEAQDVLEQIKNIQDQINSFNTSYGNYDGSNGQELIDEANDIALAMKDAGFEAEAEAIHLAAVRAEALGTSEAYAELAKTVDESSQSMERNANFNIMEASNDVLDTQNTSLEEIIKNEQELKRAREELNNLDPFDENYEEARANLEAYIEDLKEAATWSDEAAEAAHAYMDAAGEITGANLALTTGHEMRALGTRSEDARAASMDYYSLQQQFSQNVAGFDQLDELEQIDFMLQHVQDDAQKAALEVEQLLRANENLTAGDRQYLTAQMEQAGLSAEQSLQFVATLDENASRQEINTRLNEITQSGEPFEIALRATMDPQQVREMVEAQLAEYQPTDEDVNSEDFQTMANMFMANEENMGKEGTPFENYSADLLENADALKEVIESMLRYDDAIESLNSNLEDWREALNDTNEFSLEHIHAVQELQETYADFLDLSEDFDVSEEFAANAENLELMEDAANGVEGAYEALAQAAAQDILIHADVQDIDAAQEALGGLFDYLNGDAFAALNVGDAIDLSSIEDQINALAEATGWTADQMSAYLASVGINIPPDMFAPIAESAEIAADQAISAMDPVAETAMSALDYSVDTEVESKTDTQPDEIVYTNLTPHPTAAVPITSTFTVGNATYSNTGLSTTGGWSTATSTAEVRGVEYTADPVTTTEIKEMTGYGLTSKPKKGGKGGVKLKEGATGSKGSTGGSKRSGGSSRPSSGGGRGGGCFVAGTLVSLQNQFKNIEDIQIGDIVLSYNEEIHQNEYSIVLQTMIHDVTEEIYDLYIEDEILTVTGIHRFYVRRKHDIEWIPASDLHIGDYVLFADGNWHPIFKIKVKIRSLLVYNFEVSHNHNYYVGRNQILAHNKGGGGGGGSAKTIEPKEKKEHKKDYYERVNSQLDKLKQQLSGIEKQEDRLIGSKARANQQKQIKLIEREIELEKDRLGILQSAKENELTDVKALMKAKEEAAEEILKAQKIAVTDLPSPKEDAEGIITNYEEISRAIDERHNDLIDKYNDAAKAGNEELTKTIDEAIKKFDDYSAAILENAKRQNDIQKEIESTKNTIQELSDSIEDINIEIYKVSLEAIESLKDLNETHAEFAGFLSGFKTDSPLRALIEDLDELNNSYAVSADRVQEFYSTLIAEKEKAKKSADDDEKAVIDKEIEYFQKKINEAAAGTETELWANGEVGYYLEALRELRKWMNGEEDEDSPNIFGNNTKALYETYLDIYKKTAKSTLDYEKMVEDTVGDIIDIYDEVADKQEEYLKGYEHWVEKFEKFKDMYTLAYGEESYAAISALEKKQGEILQAQTQRQQEIYNYWAAQYAEAIKEGSGVSQEVKDAIKEHMQEAEEALWDLGQEAGETFVQAYEDAVKGAVQKLNSQVLPEGDSDFNRIDREWEWAKEFVDNYKDEVEKTFEVEKLRNKYADLLNEAQGSSLATQNKIRKQMEEQLKLLEDEEHMSQFDIDLANSKLLILQKQIALEDAQRNKNQMQLRRDSQGNYRYVYRASQNDIAKARQEYLEAIEEGYELSKRHATDTAEKLEATLKKFGEDWENLNTDMNLSDEKRQEQSIKLMNDFIEYMDYLAEDFGEGQDGLTNILNEMVMNSTESTAKAAQLMLSNLFDNTSNLLDAEDRAWWDYANALSEIFSKINKDNRTLVEELASTTNGEMDDLRNNLTGNDGVLSVIGKEINSEDGYNSAVKDATTAIKDLNIQTQDLLTEGLQPFNDAITKNINDIISWESTLANARATLEELEEDYKRISQIMGEDAAAKNTINIPETPPSTTTPSNNTTTTTAKSTTKSATPNNSSKADGVAAAIWMLSDFGGWGSGDERARKLKEKGVSEAQSILAKDGNSGALIGRWWGKDLSKYKYGAFDTGGYTGEWGKNGKLAFLHQKELVLNAEDTRNILSAVDIVRHMTSTLGNALTNYSIGGVRSSLMNSGFGTVDQRVEIKAEFPNVKDAFEIETALTNLADKAYQYAHRKI